MGKHWKWWSLGSLPLVNWVTARINEPEILKEKKSKYMFTGNFNELLRISITFLGEVSIQFDFGDDKFACIYQYWPWVWGTKRNFVKVSIKKQILKTTTFTTFFFEDVGHKE